jgi:hypothetical protein
LTSQGFFGVPKKGDRADAFRMGEAKVSICDDEDHDELRYASFLCTPFHQTGKSREGTERER